MEVVETTSEGEWSTSFSGMWSEEADFMAQLLGNCSLPNEVPSGPNIAACSSLWAANESNVNVVGLDESSMYSSDETNTSMFSFSLGSDYSGGNSILFPCSSHESHYPFVYTNNLMTMDYCVVDGKNNSSLTNNVMEGDDFLKQDVSYDSVESDEKLAEDALQGKNSQLGMEKETSIPEPLKEDKGSSSLEMSKKRPRLPGEFQRSKKLKKSAKVEDNDNNNTNTVLHMQSSSSCCSEGDSNASHEVNGVTSSSSSKGSGALNLNRKTRASRGSATDPQSLYARKRRERINERLRILQNLVPNGTKVDISTMLEEAVQYVKFLQLQIKLLSSDELWMYAPIAYNGMDIGLDFKIPTPKPQS